MVADDRFCVFVALGEVQPGEAIEKTAEVKMMAGGTVAAIIPVCGI